jgi:hypothetical protein
VTFFVLIQLINRFPHQVNIAPDSLAFIDTQVAVAVSTLQFISDILILAGR